MKRRAAGGLAARQLFVVTGKGGVGKSTVAAALAHALVHAGRRVVLLELDPREPLHTLLDVPPSAGAFTPAGPRLTLLSLRPRAVIEDLVREKLRVAALARRVTAHPIFAHFVDGAPGMKEMAALGYALRLVRGERGPRPHADAVVLDAPATGHGVQLLAAPGLVAEAIGGGPIGRLAGQVAAFVADPARSAAIVVTLAEEMPVQEAIELVGMLETRVGRGPELVVVNGLYPAFPASHAPNSTSPEAGGAGEATWDASLTLWRRRRELNDRELARLAAAWNGPRVELPLLPLDPGPELVARLAEQLVPALGATP